ncbi:sensor histidine kinase [Sphingomonas abaci]|uniref:histidine kinase n=1 Tax=Sphingomonas abaci TaxID=237611 RepID=A0A7W7EWZ4_9SPHN|nr:HAMP domain-containing sensor histidine kinase [Sphingomonas abaci]MBB4617073.1 hypothetical protein [Sphingomonas abaci]
MRRTPRLPPSLRGLTLIFLAVFLVAVTGTGFAIHSATRATIAGLVDRRIEAAADAVTDDDGRADAALMARRIALLNRRRDTGDIGLLLLDRSGQRLAGNLAIPSIPAEGLSTLHRRDGIVGLTAGRALVRHLPGGGSLVAVAETEPFDHFRGPRRHIYLFGFGSIVLVVAAGMAAFGWIVARRIAATRSAAAAIIDGDLRRRLPLAGDGGVFDAQAATLNQMLDRIGELMRGLSEVSADIAHDLRTPLSRLRGRLALLAADADDAGMRAGLEAAIHDSDSLLALFAAILRITEVEGGARRAGFAPLDLAELAEAVGLMMIPAAEDSGHRLLVEARGPVPISGDRQLLTQAIINLVENARRHTPAGCVIRLAAGRDTLARLEVTDTGPGIAAADRPLALRRFGRLDASRGRRGHGLGLPLVEAIARLHRGTLALGDAAPGLRVTITLPLVG